MARERSEKNPESSYSIVDSQGVKTTSHNKKTRIQRGYAM